MLESWQQLLNKPIDTTGYDTAITHYRLLKDKMLDQITLQAKLQASQKGYADFINNIENLILQNASSWGEGYEKAQTTLNKVESAVAQIIETGAVSSARDLLEEIRKEISEKEGKSKNLQQTFKTRLNANRNELFARLNIDNTFIERMLGVENTSGDTSDIIAQASSYFIRYLYANLFDDKSFAEGSRFKYVMSLGGYYKELHEYEALEKILEGFLRVHHAGGTKIKGKDTEMDIFISTLNDIETGLTQSVSLTETISALQEPPGTKDLMMNLITQIESFGEQVKSKSLGKSDQFEIGNRATLYSQFLSEGGNEYSSLQALHFLARYKNIILSLGAQNVLFSSNGKRQWMADFIEEFRRQAYLLSFMRNNNKSPLSPQVGLEQLYTKSRTAIKSRFTS